MKMDRKFVRFVALGVALGAGRGVVFRNIPIGVGVGLLIGLMIALVKSRKGAEKKHCLFVTCAGQLTY